MASLRKYKASNVWYCQFYVPHPVTGELMQFRRSTGTTNKAKARSIAGEIERAALGEIQNDHGNTSKAKAVVAELVAEIETGKLTVQSARKHVARLLELVTGQTMPSFTVESWSEEWLRRKSRDTSPATMARYRSHTAAFLGWLGKSRVTKPLEAITPQDARLWRESLQDSGRVGKTTLAYCKDMNAMFRAAIREGLISSSPFGGLDAIATTDSLDRRPFSGEEVGRLLAAAPCAEWRGLILTAAFTGLRLGDAAKLRWSSIDLEARKIELMPAKTRRKKTMVKIPIQPDLLAYLLGAPVADDQPDAPVFPTLARKPIGTGSGLSMTFARIMEAAGVDRGKPSRDPENRGAGRVVWERGFHSLRHTFTTWLRSAGVSEEDRMSLTGHSTRESHQIYSHADEAALRTAIAKLPTLPQS